MALDESKDTDSVFEQGGKQYIIDNDLMQRTGSINIDFIVEGWGSGFTILSEKPVSGSCACSAEGSCCS